MALVSLLIVVVGLALVVTIRYLHTKLLKPRCRTLDEVIPLVTSRGRMTELEQLFHPTFDSEMVLRVRSVKEWRIAQRNRLRRCKASLAAVEENVCLFQDLGRNGLLESEGKPPLALDAEDHLSHEIFERATVCRILLKYVRLRVEICSLLPLAAWSLFGAESSKLCVSAGHNLVLEYGALIEAALTFSRMKGDFYYDNLLCAL